MIWPNQTRPSQARPNQTKLYREKNLFLDFGCFQWKLLFKIFRNEEARHLECQIWNEIFVQSKLVLVFLCFFVCQFVPSCPNTNSQVKIRIHKLDKTKININGFLVWLKVLRNFCTVPCLFCLVFLLNFKTFHSRSLCQNNQFQENKSYCIVLVTKESWHIEAI